MSNIRDAQYLLGLRGRGRGRGSLALIKQSPSSAGYLAQENFYFEAASGISGTATTSQAQTVAGTGSVTSPAITGAEATSQAQKSAGSGAYTPALVTGTASTSQAQTIAGTGAFIALVTGTAATSQAQASASSGAFTPALVTGSVNTSQAQTTSGLGAVSGGETDTHDGEAWRRYRRKLERIVNMQDALEVVQEAPQEAIEAIQDADVKPKLKAKIATLDYRKVLNDRKLQEFIARQLLIVVEFQRVAQEDDDLLTFMMMD